MDYVQHILSGVASGCIYGLVALGFVLIYKATETLNFAQGELLMLGAFVGYTFIEILGMPYWLGFVLTITTMVLIGAALHEIALRPVLGQPQFTVVMLTIGVGLVVKAVVGAIPGWGVETRTIHTPFSQKTVSLEGLTLGRESLSIVAGTLLLCGGLYLFFRTTRLGVALQAASQNQVAAYCAGMPVPLFFALVYGLSAGIAGVAGLLLAPIALVDVNLGLIALKAFPAAVIGGFGSIPGAVVGGIIVGLVEQFAGMHLSSTLKNVAPYVVLLAVLMLRPRGLFGSDGRRRV